ncbi:MAG: hypothetical protein K9L17_09240 [Clostridiales bacterium]|nr:hypothetical protein [Clostridiales bacterium]MCF8022862.1 hypothetical protein [Clostridiales bacterium]
MDLDPELIKQFDVDLNKVKDKLIWDFDVKNEFTTDRKKGFAFVIDVIDNEARLSMYKVSTYVSETTSVAKQPPQEMLVKAIKEQGGNMENEDIYNVNKEIKDWIMDNLM